MKKYIIFLFFLFNLTVQWHDGALDIGAGSKALAQYGEEYSELDPPRWGAGGIQLPGNDEDPGGGYDPGYIQPPNIGDIPGVDPINPGDTEIKPPGDNGGVLIIVKEEEEDEKDKRDPLPEKERPVVDWGGDSEIKDDDDRWETEPTVGEEDGGGNPPPKTDPNKKPETKKPGIRDDCDEQAIKNAEKIKEDLYSDEVCIQVIDTLINYAKTKPHEYAVRVDRSGPFVSISEPIEGESANVKVKISNNTIYLIHTHNTGGYGYQLTGPSIGDVYNLLEVNYKLNETGSSIIEGDIIIAYDGSHYSININDRNKALKFFKEKGHLFKPQKSGHFQNGAMLREYYKINNTLQSLDFTINDAHDYTLTYLLDKYDTGIKIYKKEKDDIIHRELKTEQDTEEGPEGIKIDIYIPKICPKQ